MFNVRHGAIGRGGGASREQRTGCARDARLAPADIEVAGLAADLMGRISPTLCMWARRRDDGSLAWLSGGFAELTGRDAEDYLGRSDLTELVHPEDLGMFRGAPGDIAEQVLTWRLVRPDGGMRWVRSQVVATIEVPAGEHFWVGVIEDVTLDVAERQHRQRMEAAFAELSFALNDADAAEVDAALDHGLCLLGELVGADRSYVFRLHGAGLLSNTHEWCAPRRRASDHHAAGSAGGRVQLGDGTPRRQSAGALGR